MKKTVFCTVFYVWLKKKIILLIGFLMGKELCGCRVIYLIQTAYNCYFRFIKLDGYDHRLSL